MCCIWDIAIWTPSLLPLYVPFELCEKFGIRFGPPPTFWDNVLQSGFFEGIPKLSEGTTHINLNIVESCQNCLIKEEYFNNSNICSVRNYLTRILKSSPTNI